MILHKFGFAVFTNRPPRAKYCIILAPSRWLVTFRAKLPSPWVFRRVYFLMRTLIICCQNQPSLDSTITRANVAMSLL